MNQGVERPGSSRQGDGKPRQRPLRTVRRLQKTDCAALGSEASYSLRGSEPRVIFMTWIVTFHISRVAIDDRLYGRSRVILIKRVAAQGS